MQVMQLNQLQNLGWFDDLKADAAKAKADLATDLTKFNTDIKTDFAAGASKVKTGITTFNTGVKTAVVADAAGVKTYLVNGVKTLATDLTLSGQKCGTNPVCQELSRYAVGVNHHITHVEIQQWLKTGQYGQWCAANNICMTAVQEAQHDFTKGERQAVNNWLHPAHTEATLLQNLGWWADIKADAAKAKADLAAAAVKAKADAVKALHWTEGHAKTVGHDLEVAGEKCGSNQICTEIALKGISMAENKETSMVMKWVNSNQKAAWCKSNTICMGIVNKALSTATVEETTLVNKWLHQPTTVVVKPATATTPAMIMLI